MRNNGVQNGVKNNGMLRIPLPFYDEHIRDNICGLIGGLMATIFRRKQAKDYRAADIQDDESKGDPVTDKCKYRGGGILSMLILPYICHHKDRDGQSCEGLMASAQCPEDRELR